jgi:hypothetical protein
MYHLKQFIQVQDASTDAGYIGWIGLCCSFAGLELQIRA